MHNYTMHRNSTQMTLRSDSLISSRGAQTEGERDTLARFSVLMLLNPAVALTTVPREPDATGEAAEARDRAGVHRAIPRNRISDNKPVIFLRRLLSFLYARAVLRCPMASDRPKSDVGLLVGRLVLQLFCKSLTLQGGGAVRRDVTGQQRSRAEESYTGLEQHEDE